MSANPDARKCSATTAAGQPCRAWAIRSTMLCSAHSGRVGAPLDNMNATTHGFYGRAYTQQEIADLVEHAIDETLDDEIAVSRVALRRVLQQLHTDLPPEDYAKLSALAFAGARTVGRLLRDKRALSGEAIDGLTATLSTALDELSTELGIDV